MAHVLSHLNIFGLNFNYICPCFETNSYFYGTHSAGSDEVAHESFLFLICTP